MASLPVYMDHHSTTPADPRVLEAMLPYFSKDFGNPASRSHLQGAHAKEAVDRSRAVIADLVSAKPEEIIFTSGATESDNLAIKGVADALKSRGRHIITQRTEHKAVLDTCRYLQEQGHEVTYLDVDAQARIDPRELSKVIRSDTILISIMLSNNEVGTVHDIPAIGAIAREKGVLFHCDAAQGIGYLKLSAQDADLISLSAHKMYGPKGMGALVVSKACQDRGFLKPLIHGGGHERGLRSGTLNVPGIVGFARAAEIMREEGSQEAKKLAALRDSLQKKILDALDDVKLNGAGEQRHPGNLNLSFGYVDGAQLLLELSKVVAVSSGSACSSATPEPSYVLTAMGVPKEWASASIRFGLGRHTTEQEVNQVVGHVIATVNQQHERSPAWKLHKQGKRPEW